MINYIKELDKNIFLYFNGYHSPFFDKLMFFVSSSWFWIPIILLIIFLCIKTYKSKFYLPLLIFIFCFTVTDLGSGIIKKSVKRYRPSHNLEIQNEVHTVSGYKGGLYGFFSGHATNSFGLAVLISLFFRRKWITFLSFLWAILVSYSRIYLGVHYPSDILVGIIVGTLIGTFFYLMSTKIRLLKPYM